VSIRPRAPRIVRVVRSIAVGAPLFLMLVLGGDPVGIRADDEMLVRITSTVSPATLTIAPGVSVRFRNDDDERHRLRSRTGPVGFDTNDLEPGESYRVTFSVVGRYPYVDERERDATAYHGTIVVGSAPPAATATATATTPPDPGTAPKPGPAAATRGTVRMAGRAFSPATLTIAAGGSVAFQNDDDRAHTATGDAIDSGILEPGRTYAKTFPSPGRFSFLCLLHPEMTGTVVVTTGPAPSGPGPTGSAGRPLTPGASPSSSPEPSAAPEPTPTASLATTTPEEGTGPGVAVAGPSPTTTPAPAAVVGSADRAPASVAGNVARLTIGAVIVVLACALFAAAIRGTARSPERAEARDVGWTFGRRR
jgi:plastocyanin